MFSINTMFASTILIILGVLGAWLIGLFSDGSETDGSGTYEIILALLGLFLLIGVVCGFAFMIGRSKQSIIQEQKISWEEVRDQGKLSYVRNFVSKVSLPLLAGFSFPALYDYLSGKAITLVLRNYGILLLVFIFCSLFAAFRSWNYFEQSLKQKQI